MNVKVIEQVTPIPSDPALHQLPPPPADFTGRAAELTDLRAQLTERGVTIHGLRGLGGVGKTALARKLAEELKPRYPDAQFDLDLKGTDKQPLTSAEAMAHVIRGYHPDRRLPDNQAELTGLYHSVLDGQRALLLMDNAAGPEQVEPLIPPKTCLLLVTSRRRFTLPGLYALDLDALPPDDACKLLLSIAPRLDCTLPPDVRATLRGCLAGETVRACEAIAQLCGCLPIALRAAGGALAENIDLNPADYVKRLTDARQRLNLVNASFSLSYDLLPEDLGRWWGLLSVFPDTFGRDAAAAVWDLEPDAAQDALSSLVRYSLVDYLPVPVGGEGQGRYRLHDLARLYAASRLSAPDRAGGERRHAVHYQTVLSTANDLYLQGGEALRRGLSLFDEEWANIQTGQAWAVAHAEEDEVTVRLCNNYPGAGPVLALRQHPQERIRWLEAALVAARAVGDRMAEVTHLGGLGNAYAALGQAGRAIDFYQQCLSVHHEIGDRLGESMDMCNLGLAYADLGETRRAIDFYEQYLTVIREMGNRRGEGNALGGLGLAYVDLGEPHRAIECFEQYLAIARVTGDRRGEGNAQACLGLTYTAMGNTHRAIECLEQALAIYQEIGDQGGEGTALGNLGNAYADLGETRQAIKYHEQALAIDREIGDRRGEANAHGNLGVAYAVLGETRRAIEYHEKYLAIAREVGDRRGEGNALGNLGLAYAELGETRQAIKCHEEYLTIAREIGDRRGEGNALGNLGNAYAALGETRRAIDYLERRFVIAREIGDRRGEGNALGNLGLAYAALGETRRAMEFHEQQLIITREIGDRRGEGNARFNLGQALDKLGDRAGAIAHVTAALEIFEQIESPHAEQARQQLAEWKGQ